MEEERAIAGECGYPCCGNQLPRDYANSGGRFKVGLGDGRVHRTEVRGRESYAQDRGEGERVMHRTEVRGRELCTGRR